ncbi:hypothetical protein [Streptomyces sp. JJ36]|uniref:hypothetical protein n=1 Tax=Streptomyces sp. JJ36 TaxID=2736645 RepID=UPI001F48C331|nr:hypothetical protein [Streptomyces sp. JJ36]
MSTEQPEHRNPPRPGTAAARPAEASGPAEAAPAGGAPGDTSPAAPAAPATTGTPAAAATPSGPPGPAPADEGGEPACLLDRVCPECGGLADAPPPTACPRCGAPLPRL